MSKENVTFVNLTEEEKEIMKGYKEKTSTEAIIEDMVKNIDDTLMKGINESIDKIQMDEIKRSEEANRKGIQSVFVTTAIAVAVMCVIKFKK